MRYVLTTLLLVSFAIVAFAGNSVLTRLALSQNEIGAIDFAGIRLFAGALTLVLLSWRNVRQIVPRSNDWLGILALFIYAIAFTIAYTRMNASSGALVLFAVVQITMVLVSTFRGSRPSLTGFIGILIAFGGLVWLLAPRASSPPLGPALLMSLAGVAWGLYTLAGRGATDPLAKTARNFLGAAVLGLPLMLIFPGETRSLEGIVLAIASGAVTSALGYAVWYAALPRLTVATAGASQLTVPVVAALGGALWIGEVISAHLLLGAALVLGGVGLTLVSPKVRT